MLGDRRHTAGNLDVPGEAGLAYKRGRAEQASFLICAMRSPKSGRDPSPQPRLTSLGRCCSPASELSTTMAPVSAGNAHWRMRSWFCAEATSSGVASTGWVAEATGTSVRADTVRPSR